ncbi:ISNCY family transposase [Singulisphaera sp. PoT]|uniref:ISNCY family transposase n=1 Tax=Singulisphaera sp. PoT TaxID=3411797 RepID=UPI003BF5296E
MLRDRYEPVDLFRLIPQLGLVMEPWLAALDQLLDDDQVIAAVRADFVRRYRLTASHGRPSTPVEVLLRMLVVMRIYGWSYEQAEYHVKDSLVLRQFCRVYLERVPDDTTLIRWANTLGPEAIRKLNDRVVELARRKKIARGRKLRVDTTAVETDIHFPTDSGLIGDGIRVASRLFRRAKAVLGEAAEGLGDAFRGRVRTVRRISRELHRIARRKGDEARSAMRAGYEKLVATAREAISQAGRVREALKDHTEPKAARIGARLGELVPRLMRCVDQAVRRVLRGESVPSAEKLVSIFEPHSQVIPRHKAGKPVEFGRKIRLDEVEGGIVSGYAILDRGGGQDQPYLADALDQHQRMFARAPDLLAADRGMSSAGNQRLARDRGVKHVALPHVGKSPPGRRALEKERWFRRGYRFRAGIEGRIHALKRDFGLRRCRYRGEDGMGRWVGWGIVAHNLSKVAESG